MNRLETDVFHRFLAQPEVITAEGIIKTTDYNGSIIDCYCRLLKVLIATGAHSVYAIYMMRSLGEETDAEPDFDARSDYKFVAYCVDGEKLYSDSDKLKVAFDMDADPIDKEHVATIWGNYLRTIVEPNPGKVLNSKQIDLAANLQSVNSSSMNLLTALHRVLWRNMTSRMQDTKTILPTRKHGRLQIPVL